jgi:hypothetical protein
MTFEVAMHEPHTCPYKISTNLKKIAYNSINKVLQKKTQLRKVHQGFGWGIAKL